MSADRVADEAAKLTDQAKQTGQDAIDQAGQGGQDVLAQAREKFAGATGLTPEQAREKANQAAQDLATSIRAKADGLSTEKLYGGVDYIRQTDRSQLIGDAQDLARRNQGWLIGIGVVGAILLLWALWSAMRREPQA
jgi:hypothetical protein